MTTTQLTEKQSYSAGLQDPQWQLLREKVLDRDGHRCRCCGSEHSLQVHHRQYHRDRSSGAWKSPWEYPLTLLVTLCDECHSEGHRLYPIPVKEV
ncbi:MAG: hypothetical protein JJU34_09505 [Lunatimonas sp.]|uniref:hypothetical protein n=1 Tax=Lunatimonas sp. TaxID=2060141 RepID=UPI00263A81F7|nr:hypothetical protein [Lunatimonas sp.]MCC5937507.1 hypothetical protein [Lunatimonas sp.]